MSEQQTEPSIEDQLLDAQMHVGRLQNELALAKKGIAGVLRWSTMRPAMSGLYLSASMIVDGAPAGVRVIAIEADGTWRDSDLYSAAGPYFAGPLEIGGPE